MERKPKSKFVECIEYYPALAVACIIRSLPLSLAFKISVFFSTLFYYIAYTARRQALQHVMHAKITSSEAEAKKLVLANFRHLGKVAVEIMTFDKYIQPDEHYKNLKWVTSEEGDSVLRSGTGIVMVGCHFGNWELSGLVYSITYNPIVSVVNPFENKKIDQYVQARRKHFDQTICPKKEAVKTAVRILKQGKTLGILSDQHAGKSAGGILTTFFGQPASSYPTAAYLSLKLNYPLFLGFARRRGDNFNYEYSILGPFKIEKSGNMETDIRNLTQAHVTALENEIRKTPEQWVWTHRRWLNINRKRSMEEHLQEAK